MRREVFLFSTNLFAAAVVAICLPFSASAQATAALESNVQIITPRSLTANQATAFEEFVSDGRYNGALYVSQDGSFHWRTNLNTLEAAKLLANQSCSRSERNCQIYATLTPKRALLADHIKGLSQSAAREAEGWVRDSATNGRSAAIAASGYAGWAGWGGKMVNERLRTSALNHCGDLLLPRVQRLEERQRAVLDRASLLKCKIILTQPAR